MKRAIKFFKSVLILLLAFGWVFNYPPINFGGQKIKTARAAAPGQYTTTALNVLPSAAAGVSVTGSGTAWANSSWVQITASTANAIVAAGLVVGGGVASEFEIDIGKGASGSETVVATISGSMESAASSPRWLMLPIPVDNIPVSTRVAVRVRRSGITKTAWMINLVYYNKPVAGALSVTQNPSLVVPSAVAGTSIAGSGTAWANTAWTQIIASTADAIALGGITINPAHQVEWEVDVGVGASGSEAVVTTFRGNSATAGAPQTIILKPLLDNIPSGSRVSIRFRKAGTGTTAWTFKLIYYNKTSIGVGSEALTAKPLKWSPTGAAGASVTGSGTAWANSSWVQLIASTATTSSLAAVEFNPQDAVDFELEFGVGSAGNEVPIGLARGTILSTTLGNIYTANIAPLIDSVPSGSRLAVRLRKGGTVTTNWTVSAGYYENTDTTNKLNGPHMALPYSANSVTISPAGSAWANSSYGELTTGINDAIYITRIVVDSTVAVQFEADIATGAAGSEVVQTTVAGQVITTTGNSVIDLPVPLQVSANTRIAIRFRNSGTTGTWTFGLEYARYLTAPSTAPGTPTYTNISTSTLTVNWTSATSSDYYNLERGTDGNNFSQISTTTALSYNDTSLVTSTTYYYRLRGTNYRGSGPYSASSSVTTTSGITSSFTQKDYRWYQNADAIQPTTALATEDAAATLSSTSTIVRLRANVNLSGAALATSSQAFKLQWSTATSSGWADINNPANVQSVATAVSAGTVSDATGRPTQNHLIYAVNDRAWWLFYIDSTASTTLKTMRSTDLVTWTAGATETLTRSHKNTAIDFAVAYANISGTDVAHIQFSYPVGAYNGETYHSRATISGGAITFTNTEAINNNSTVSTDANNIIDAPNLIYDSNNKVVVSSDFMEGTSGYENINFSRSTNTDLGSSWTAGFPVSTRVYIGTGYQRSHVMASLGSANYLGVAADANMNFTNLLWTKYTDSTTSYSTAANVRGSALGTAQDQNDWGMARISNTDTRLIMRTGSNTYEGFKFDGTSWTTMTAPGNQTSKAGGGMFLATDGTDFWLFIIDSDAFNTIRYNKFTVSAGTWGGWTALVTTSQTRSYLSGYQSISNGTVGLIWSQTNGSNYDIVSGAFPVAWQFYNNPSVATSTAITSTLLASSTAKETYEEQNPTAVNPTAIPVGGLGEWDFPLNPANATSTTYYFQFVKSDGTALYNYTNYPAITVGGGSVPGIPGAPTYASVSTSTLVVNWTSASGANYYKIERGTDGNTFAQITTTTLLTYSDSGLSPNTSYFYRLRGNNASGDGPYSASSTVKLLPDIPGTPTYTSVLANTLTVNWTAPAGGADYYKIERGASGGGPFSQISTTTALNYPDSGLVASTTYWYQVRGTNTQGDGPYSATSSVTTGAQSYAASSTLTSAPFDTTGSANGPAYKAIKWLGNLGGPGQNQGRVRFQLATSPNSTGPWSFIGGASCDSSGWYDPGGSNTAAKITCASLNHNGQRYFKYKIELCSNDCSATGAYSPTVTDVIISWSP